ncbi:unnamed protein product [Kuraishia capsulata CBS 1993]|uniref:Mediator of RNA polymerase II transcription subunit 10 n=1 Tax=Kuraishia capsulata CBS 1993 TaxID=1382522 RepID=W6MJC1_9ASCO|nr:uncharacterized protein KUCA_T00000476001 [Kuraishia capsulata CBS 1993]CDK24512.1 unnamed protein product [Kuraishia capsulata CBS 1993]
MTTDTPIEDKTTSLGRAQDELANLIETLIHLGVQVHDFTGTNEAKAGLANNINKVIGQLQEISTSHDLKEYSIPMEVLNYVEDGRNPDVYTREFVEVVRKVNQFLNGKAVGFGRFRDVLGDKIIQEFPELTDSVHDIKTRTS